MLDFIKRFFGFSKAQPATEAPYKIETPAYEPKKCGCGRSETGLCVGLHSLSEAEWSTHEKNPNKAPAKKKAAKKAPAKAKATVTKAKAPAKAKTKKTS